MADPTVKNVLSICATTENKLSDLVIKNGQLIFVHDKHKLAFDYDGERTFYNHIKEIDTEDQRKQLDPVDGLFYFVINTAVLWTYRNKWIPLTTPPEEVMFIGVELPELGSANTLYVKKGGGISIWDDGEQCYITVADNSAPISISEINALFL